MMILLGYSSVDKAQALPVFVKTKSVLFFLPDNDLDWPNQEEKQPFPFPECTAHPASMMNLSRFRLSKSTTSLLSYYVRLPLYKVETVQSYAESPQPDHPVFGIRWDESALEVLNYTGSLEESPNHPIAPAFGCEAVAWVWRKHFAFRDCCVSTQ